MRVIAAMPAYNEAKYVASLVKQAKKYADEVCVADDGSTDDTARLAREAGATVLMYPHSGYGNTIRRIMAEARRQGCDVLVILDADNQHYPEDIPRMVEPLLDGYDMVIGKRHRIDVPVHRYAGGGALSLLTALISGGRVVDSQSGFKVLSRRALATIEPEERGMAITSEIVIRAFRRGLRIKEIPIRIRYSEDSSTYNPFAQGFYTVWRLLMIWVRRRW